MSEIQGPSIVSYNPATGEKLGEVPRLTESQVQAAKKRAYGAQPGWANRPIEERAQIIQRFANLLQESTDEVAQLLVSENGKTYQEALSTEIVGVVDTATFYAKRARKVLKPHKLWLHFFPHKASELVRVPRGVVLIISPWNFPLSIPFGAVIFSLLAGNSVVLKPASLTPLIAMRMEKLLHQAGVPQNVFQVITCSGGEASKLIASGVDYVNFTGSTEVGVQVAQTCAKYMIPCSMELGGKDPAIVCSDAALQRAANGVTWGAFCNSGQICASVERAYVHRSIYDRFVDMVVERVLSLRQGDPSSSEVDIGAMTDMGQLEIVAKQVEQAQKSGARILTGGRQLPGPGQFYAPTVIATEDTSLDIVQQESFGPVLPIIPFDDEYEAIRAANDSQYGLVASIWTKDIGRGRKIAEQLVTGTAIINDVLYTHAVPETPWFGAKYSGIGVVHSDEGLLEMTRTVHVNFPRVPTGPREASWYPYSSRTTTFLKNAIQAAATGEIKAMGKTLVGMFR